MATTVEHECQNCGSLWATAQLQAIRHYWMRVEEGEPEPSGECPDCGALCHPVEESV